MSSGAYFKIGLFVIVAVGIGVAAVFILGAKSLSADEALNFETYMNHSVQGLDVGAKVKMRGVPVGEVTAIEFARARYGMPSSYVQIEFILEKSVIEMAKGDLTVEEMLAERLQAGLRIRLASGGLTGAMYMELDILDDPPEQLEFAWKPDSYYVPSVPSTMEQFTEDAKEVVKDIKGAGIDKIGQELGGAIADLRGLIKGDLARSIEDVRVGLDKFPAVMDKLGTAMDEVNVVLKDADGMVKQADGLVLDLRKVVQGEVTTTIKDVDIAVKSIQKDFDGLTADLRTATRNELTPALANIRKATEGLPNTIALANRSLRRIDIAVLGQEDEVAAVLHDLKRLASDLEQFTDMVKRYPSHLLFGDAPPRSRKERER